MRVIAPTARANLDNFSDFFPNYLMDCAQEGKATLLILSLRVGAVIQQLVSVTGTRAQF